MRDLDYGLDAFSARAIDGASQEGYGGVLAPPHHNASATSQGSDGGPGTEPSGVDKGLTQALSP